MSRVIRTSSEVLCFRGSQNSTRGSPVATGAPSVAGREGGGGGGNCSCAGRARRCAQLQQGTPQGEMAGGVYSRFSNRSSLTGLSPGAEAERQSLAAAGGGRLHSQGGPPQAAAQPNDAQRAGDKGATGAAERRGVRVCSAASCHCVGA